MVDIVEGVLGIQTVPILDWEYVLPSSIDELLEYAEDKSILNPEMGREGVVFVREESKNWGRMSFKVISNKFLIDNK